MLTSCVPAQPPFELSATFDVCLQQHNQLSFYNVFPACREMKFTVKWTLQLGSHMNIYFTDQDLLDRHIQITFTGSHTQQTQLVCVHVYVSMAGWQSDC